jgi:hypothetical protein
VGVLGVFSFFTLFEREKAKLGSKTPWSCFGFIVFKN